MTTPVQNEDRHRDHLILYGVLATILTAVAIVGIFTFSYKHQSKVADEKAAKLEQRWAELGLKSTQDRDELVRLYGTDGGAVCDTSSKELSQALLRTALANGAAGPGQRPVIVDKGVLTGERAVVEVYCPDHLKSFDSFVNDLKYGNVTRDV